MSVNVPNLPPRAAVSGAAVAQRLLTLQSQIEAGAYASGFEGLPDVDPGTWLKAVITARTPVTYDPALPPWPEAVMYECVIVDVGATVSMRLPVYGRPAIGREARIIPQNVGEICWVVRRIDQEGEPVAEICVLRERVWRRPCRKGTGVPPPPPPSPSPNPDPATRPYAPPRNTDPSTTPSAPVY